MTTETYRGPLRQHIEGLIQQKRALGYQYDTEARALQRFDQFCIALNWTAPQLDKPLVDAWNQKRPYEAHATWTGRIQVVRQLALYMARLGLSAYVLPTGTLSKGPRYVPHIFSEAELAAFSAQWTPAPIVPKCPIVTGPCPSSFASCMAAGCACRRRCTCTLPMWMLPPAY